LSEGRACAILGHPQLEEWPMYEGRTVFAQLMDHLPQRTFRRLVGRYDGNSRVKTFTCWDQFLCMVFAQLTYRESLRDIEACLGAVPHKLYHLGFRTRTVARSTLADANERRDWRLYADLAQRLVVEARRLYVDEPIGLEQLDASERTVYALDATTVDLCLSLFPWARFRTTKAGIKLHTLLDVRGAIPVFIWITDAKRGDVEVLDVLIPEPGSIYLMDRAYVDFERLHRLNEARATFVTRAKKNFRWHRRYSRPVDRSTGLVCDQTIGLTRKESAEAYPAALRRVKYRDPETGKVLVFLMVCPPGSGPGRMRVLRPELVGGLDEGKEAQAGADHPEAAESGGGAGGGRDGSRDLPGVGGKRGDVSSVAAALRCTG
jgi:hypothetical protein